MNKLRLGMVGLTADRGWASAAHLPALRALSQDVELVGVANRTRASAEAAIEAIGMGRAFDNVDSLVRSTDIDAVVVTVKVRHHRDIVQMALEAGKHVFCEWPLAASLADAEQLASLAKRQQVVAVIGTQAAVAPELLFLRDLVAEGYVGDLRSTTFLGSGYTWGDDIPAGNAYALDPGNGATLLSVMGGHSLFAMQLVLGPIASIGGHLAQRQFTARIEETGETIPMLTPDQMVAAGEFESGVPFAFQLRGGLPCDARLFWEIGGSERDLRITPRPGAAPAVNNSHLRIESCERGQTEFQELAIPEKYDHDAGELPTLAQNVFGLYRLFLKDIRENTKTAPNFDDAAALHELLDHFERTQLEDRRPSSFRN